MHYRRCSLVTAGLLALTPAVGHSQIVTEKVAYTHNGQAFEGYAAYNQALGDDQPTVIILHDWDGLGDYETIF